MRKQSILSGSARVMILFQPGLLRCVLFFAVLWLGMGCSLESIDIPELPGIEDLTGGDDGALSGVAEIKLSPVDASNYLGTFRFESPVSPETVEGRLFLTGVVGADGQKFAHSTLIEPQESFGYFWDTSNSTVTVQFRRPQQNIFRAVVAEGIYTQSGRPIDGQKTINSNDNSNLARSSDDGFSGGSTHVSLPLFVNLNELESHPKMRLNQDRPLVSVNIYGQDASQPVQKLVSDRQHAKLIGEPQKIVLGTQGPTSRRVSDTTIQRIEPFFFAPDANDYISIVDANGVTIPVDFYIDTQQEISSQSYFVTQVTNSFIGLDGLSRLPYKAAGEVAILVGENALKGRLVRNVLLAPGGIEFSTLQITDGVGSGIDGQNLFRDASQTWTKDELVLQIFKGGLTNALIVSNTANTITLSDPLSFCSGGCSYTVGNNANVSFSTSSAAIRVVATELVAQVDGLADKYPFPWTLRIDGGRRGLSDVYGVPFRDGVRDGDEASGVIDDRFEVILDLLK